MFRFTALLTRCLPALTLAGSVLCSTPSLAVPVDALPLAAAVPTAAAAREPSRSCCDQTVRCGPDIRGSQ